MTSIADKLRWLLENSGSGGFELFLLQSDWAVACGQRIEFEQFLSDRLDQQIEHIKWINDGADDV